MDKEEILQALRYATRDLVSAEQLVAEASLKLRTILSQLSMEWNIDPNLLPTLEAHLHQQPEDGKPRPLETSSPEPLAGVHTAGINIASGARAAPAPAASAAEPQRVNPSKPAIDFSDPAVRSAPQSPASRVETGFPELPEPPAAPAAATPTPVAARPPRPHNPGPTLEQPPAEAPKAPTRERTETQREKYDEQVRHFVGVGSLFSRHLSPTVIASGKGFLKPGVAGLHQYSEDILQLTPARMAEWPAGFYRDHVSAEMQFFLITTRGLVVVPMLPRSDQMPQVALAPYTSQTQLVAINTLPMLDMLMLKEAVEAVLKNLSGAVQI